MINQSSNATDHELHRHALEIAGRYLKSEFELVEIIQKINQKRSYLSLRYKNLHVYCVSALKLSNDVAYYFIKVAKKSVEVPQLKAAIQTGELTVSQARQVASVLTPTNANELITKAKIMTQTELQKEVARINPKAATPDKAKYVSESVLELKFAISERVMGKFKRAKDLECQKKRTHCTFEEVLEGVLDIYLAKQDPLLKAKRVMNRKTISATQITKKASKKIQVLTETKINCIEESKNLSQSNWGKRTPVPSEIQHKLRLRDQGQCTQINKNGIRCEEQKWLHHHHVKEISSGGTHELDNLTTLCFSHHRLHHHLNSHHDQKGR